jgi:hypothetical protein
LNETRQYLQCDRNICESDLDFSRRRSGIITIQLLLPLYVRTLIFRLYLECALQLSGHLTEEHKKKWLLFQLASKTFTGKPDLFLEYIHKFARAPRSFFSQAIVDEWGKIRRIFEVTPSTRVYCVLDNAQNMADVLNASSQSSTSSTTSQHPLGQITELWSSYFTNFIASGTAVTLPPLGLTSDMCATEGPSPYIISDTGAFDAEEKLVAYLRRYIPVDSLNSKMGRYLRYRITYWLRGRYAVPLPSNKRLKYHRYQFTASYVALLLRRGFESPHQLLNELVYAYTKFKPSDFITEGDLNHSHGGCEGINRLDFSTLQSSMR